MDITIYRKNIRQKVTILIVFTLILQFTSTLHGQIWKLRRYEVGAGIGNSQIFGDIGGTFSENNLFGLRDIQLKETRPALHFYARYKINHVYSIKANVIIGNGYGSDETSGLERQRSYKALIGEFSGNFEYYFLRELRKYRSRAGYHRFGMRNNYNMFAAYLFTGIGMTYSHSSHEYPAIWPVRDDYRPGGNFVPIIPVGLGLKLIIDDHWMLASELGYRYTLSDFVDGYTHKIHSKFNDVYYMFDVSIVYRLKTTKRNIPAILDRKYKQMIK